MNPDAPWRDVDGTPTEGMLRAGRRVLKPKNNTDRWARHDHDTEEARNEAEQTQRGGNR